MVLNHSIQIQKDAMRSLPQKDEDLVFLKILPKPVDQKEYQNGKMPKNVLAFYVVFKLVKNYVSKS